jgi:hypothetical protein
MTDALVLDLPHGYQTVIDADDAPLVAGLTLYRGTRGYVYYSKQENKKRATYTLHALLVRPPKGLQVDHINGDTLDNRRSNLRVVTVSINQLNRKKPNRNSQSGVVGVGRHEGRWRARISIDGETHHLGRFATIEAAAAARRQAEIELLGEEILR